MPESELTAPPKRGLLARMPFDAHGLLTSDVRRFFAGTLLGALGVGLVLPFFMIYCVHVRHFQPWQGGAILAWEAVLGVSISPVYGTLIDRYGPSRILTITMPLSSLGLIGIALSSTIWQLFAVATFFAAIGAGMWSAFTTLVTRIVAEEHRPDAFGINFMLLNLGIGIGVVAGGIVADVHSLRSFQVLYLAAAILSLGNAAVWWTLRHRGGPLPTEQLEETSHEGWREVLQDRVLLRYVAFSVVLMVCGYGSVEAGLPLFITNVAHLSTHVVGLIFVFNTMTIVVGQIFSLGAIRGRSRSMILGVVGLCWGASWLLATASVYVGAVAAVIGLCVGQIVFATGETLYQPVSTPLVNDLAPEHLRGRYNSLVGIIWGVSGAIGELIASLFLQFHMGVAWSIFVAMGAILGGYKLTTLRSVLTPQQDGLVIPRAPSEAGTQVSV